MNRPSALILVLGFLTASLALAPAKATPPLLVDAGSSQVALNGAPIALEGVATGGTPPYAFAWSWSGDPSRFGATTFSTTGLSPQDVVLTLTVTDNDGTQATDTVRHRVDAAFHLEQDVSLLIGIPDEVVGLSLDQRTIPFTLPSGLSQLTGTMSWPDTLYDLDIRLLTPAGADATGTQGASSANPEVVSVASPVAGAWTAKIEPFLSLPTTAHVVLDASPAVNMPAPQLTTSSVFGATDPQNLGVTATGGASPYAYSWDLDGDGIFETSGATATTSFGVGQHVVDARVTDATGFEVALPVTVTVSDADTILRLRCGNDPTTPYWAMEFSSTKGSCWIHGGHHTYFLGDHEYALRSLSGFVFTVEQQFSPPTEHNLDNLGTTPLHVEVSMDGLTWTEVAHGEYRFASLEERQRVDIAATGANQSFRFLRIHEPLSAAQGLSGYLDHSQFDVEADVVSTIVPPTPVSGTRSLSCEKDLMEDFFVLHPCWFGGIDRYDAPSFWHTYPLGDGAQLSRVRGNFTLAPWRVDDWYQGEPVTSATKVHAYVQVSADGVAWTDVATVNATFGVPQAFDVTLPGSTPASFVRLFPAYHARFDDMANFASNHHPRGYFLDSDVQVDGLLPP